MRHDLAALRVIAILAILFHHSCIAFHGWPPGVECDVPFSMTMIHISGWCKMIGLGLFTFISGYLLNLQCTKPQAKLTFIIKKSRRLLLPAIIFGAAYLILFPGQINPDFYPDAINGTHLWYLPVIFLCLVITFLIKPNNSARGIISMAAVEIVFIALALLKTPIAGALVAYFPIFAAGYFHYMLKNKYLCIGGGILSYFIYMALKSDNEIPMFQIWGYTAMMICLSIFGSYVAQQLVKKPLPNCLATIDRHSFHIYLIHQFIINALLINIYFSGEEYILAPTVFIIVFVISLLLSLCWEKGASYINIFYGKCSLKRIK